MYENECLRKSIYYKLFSSIIVLFFIGAVVGRSKDNSVEIEDVTAKVVGRVEADSGLTGISVKLIRLDDLAKSQTVSLKDVYTNSEGKFILETYLDGETNLLVLADKNNKEWRGVLTAGVKPGIAVYSQPLNDVTTVCADLFIDGIKSGGKPEYPSIRLLIDNGIAGTLDSNREFMNNVTIAVETEINAEKETLLRPEIGGTTSQWQQINIAKFAAQTAFDRDLYYAVSKSAQQTAMYSYLGSLSDAYVDVGLQSDTFSKVLEASIRTLLKEFEGINSRLEFEFKRRTAEIRAAVLNVSVLSEFQKLGADPSIVNQVIYAGEDLQENVEKIQSAEELSTEFDDYRDLVLNILVKVLGVYGNSIRALQVNVAEYKEILITEVGNSSGMDGIISAYINFYGNINNLVKQQIYPETVQQNAAAEVLILLNMYF